MLKVFAMLTAHAMHHPKRIAVSTTDGASIGYGALAQVIAAFAERLSDAPTSIAIAGTPSIAWIVADLAITLTGRKVVPIPFFFSADQQAHILKDATVGMIVDCSISGEVGSAREAGVPVIALNDRDILQDYLECGDVGLSTLAYMGGAERIIYTSGTTGRPKGVRHGDRQIGHAVPALSGAASASRDDRHLSALPPALLLEQIAGQFLPLALGAEIIVAPSACQAALTGDIAPLAKALGEQRPTTTVLVPEQLAGLVYFARATGWRPPNSLRLVAVGGAPISATILDEARRFGIPARFGYGLSECCSVVAVEGAPSPAQDDISTCGRALPGTRIDIEAGEIVVRGPSIMIGYLGQPALKDAVWRTGDLGRIDADGRVTVLGRKDRVITLSNGRNVAPEWLESAAATLPWVMRARVLKDASGGLRICLTALEESFISIANGAVEPARLALAECFAGFPDYAKPHDIGIFSPQGAEIAHFDLSPHTS